MSTDEPAESAEHKKRSWFSRIFSSEDEEEDRTNYQEALYRGSAIVAVTCSPSEVERVANIMTDLGATDIDRRAEYYQQTGYMSRNQGAAPFTDEQAMRDRENFRNQQGKIAIPVIEEELQVGKRAVRKGGVRVYSHVVERPVEENITLRDEHVTVERRTVNRNVEPGDMDRLRDQTVEFTETAEEPVVSKRARVKEEVVVGKEARERTETIRDNVRATEVRVDNLDDTNATPVGTAPDLNARRSGVTGETSPGFTFGSGLVGDSRFVNRKWDDVSDDVRTEYVRLHPESRWDQVKDDVRRGWEHATQRR
jgi:uncharacterized protein (TIGR02271 family)